MKRSLVLIFSILILSVGLARCANDESKAATTDMPTSTVAPPLPEDVRQIAETKPAVSTTTAEPNVFEATGEFVSPVRSELAPKSPGRVSKMFVDAGSHVRRGQPVLELESDYTRLNLRAAEAEAMRAKAVRDEAARDLERKKDLIAKGSIPQATFDRSQAMFEQASAAYAAANAHTALLRQQVADATLRSPVDGIIAEKRIDVGARLGDGGVAFVVLQLSPVRLRFDVPERYLSRIRVGDRVTARVDPYPNEAFEGTIKIVGGVIDPKTRTMFAEAEFANRDGRLRPGLFARVSTDL